MVFSQEYSFVSSDIFHAILTAYLPIFPGLLFFLKTIQQHAKNVPWHYLLIMVSRLMEIEISKQYLILNVWILNFNREMIIEKKRLIEYMCKIYKFMERQIIVSLRINMFPGIFDSIHSITSQILSICIQNFSTAIIIKWLFYFIIYLNLYSQIWNLKYQWQFTRLTISSYKALFQKSFSILHEIFNLYCV